MSILQKRKLRLMTYLETPKEYVAGPPTLLSPWHAEMEPPSATSQGHGAASGPGLSWIFLAR